MPLGDFNPLGECAKEVAAIAAAGEADALARFFCEGNDIGRRDGRAEPLGRLGGSLGVGLGLIASGLKFCDPFFQRRVVEVGDAAFDGAVKPSQAGVGLGGAPIKFGNMFAATLGPVVPPVENRGEDFGEAFGVKQAVFQMAGDEIVELFHWNRPAFATGVALPGGGRATVIAIAPALAGADGHGAATG